MRKSLNKRTLLLGVGAQKAGSTWLYRYFTGHPEIFMSPLKEMHFFGNRNSQAKWPMSGFRKQLRDRQAANPHKQYPALQERIAMGGDVSAYKRFFRKRIADEKVFGEVTPRYCNLDASEFAFIKSRFTSVKIIFILRNPADRLWSQMQFDENFGRAEVSAELIKGLLQKSLYSERSDYVATIKNLNKTFTPQDVHYEFFENLFCTEAIQKICSFLNVGFHPPNFEKAQNAPAKALLRSEQRENLVNLLKDQYEFVAEEFEDRLPESWKLDHW